MQVSTYCIAAAMLLIFSQPLAAQEKLTRAQSSFRIGDETLALGFGLGIRYGYVPNTAVTPAVMATYDVGVAKGFEGGTIGVGGVVAFKSAHYMPIPYYAGPAYRARWRNYLVGARISHHFALGPGFENLDLYGGVMGGFRVHSYKRATQAIAGGSFLSEESTYGLSPVVGLFGGGRYGFTSQLGAWLEIGYDVSLIKVGMHINL